MNEGDEIDALGGAMRQKAARAREGIARAVRDRTERGGPQRRQLRKDTLSLLKGALAGATVDVIGSLWKGLQSLFDGFEEEIEQTPRQECYGLVRSVKETLSLLTNDSVSLKTSLEAAGVILERIGVEKCAELVGMGDGFRDALEIVGRCMEQWSSAEHRSLGESILNALRRLVGAKKNATGCVDMMRRHLLVPFMRRGITAGDALDGFVAELMFHPSTERQYKTYLAANDEAILTGKEANDALEKAPTIHAVLQTLQSEIQECMSSSWVLPLLAAEFVERLVTGKLSDGKGQLISAKRAGFLFAAKLADAVMTPLGIHEESCSALLGILKVVECNALYEATLDEGFMQLQFLQRIARRVLVDSGTERLDRRPPRKRQKLLPSTPVLSVSHKLELCEVMLAIEHRTLMPFLMEVLTVMSDAHQERATDALLMKLMELSGRARKWTQFFAAVLSTLASDGRLGRLLTQKTSLATIREAVRNLPVLETLNFLEMTVKEVQGRCSKESELEVLVLMEAVVASLQVHESIAVGLSQCLSQLMPTFDALRMVERDSKHFLRLLKMALAVNLTAKKCMELHPGALSDSLLSSMPIESLFEVQSIPTGETLEVFSECLLLRLDSLHQQFLQKQFRLDADHVVEAIECNGERVAKLLSGMEASMSEAGDRRIRADLLTKHFGSWIALCPRKTLVAFLKRCLDDFSHSAPALEKLFLEPAVLSYQNFIRCFHAAFFESLLDRSRQIQGQCPLLAEMLVGEAPVITRLKSVKKALRKRLENATQQHQELNSGHISSILELVEFGLKLPVSCFDESRVLLEATVVVLSLVTSDVRLPICVSYFSLDSIHRQASKICSYLNASFFWTLHLAERHFQQSAPEDDVLARSEPALYALLKQVVFSQWCRGNCDFFGSTAEKIRIKPWKQKAIHAMTLLEVFSGEGLQKKDSCFSLSCLGVFVRLCTWLIGSRHQRHLPCLPIGTSHTPPWPVYIQRRMQKDSHHPDLKQIPPLLQTTLVPFLQDVLSTYTIQESDSWSELQLGLMAGIVADLVELSFKHSTVDASALVPRLLSEIHTLAQCKRWQSMPLRLERVVYFLHNSSLCIQSETVPMAQLYGMTQLHLKLLIKVLEATNDAPDPLQQPFILATSNAIVTLADPFDKVSCRAALLDSFSAFVTPLSDARAIQIAQSLLTTLQGSHSIEAKFASLQLFLVILNVHRTQIHDHHTKLPGRFLQIVYSCFWEDYFRHVLLTLVNRKRRKSVDMPGDDRGGVFCALLCSFFRCFSLCHSLSPSIPQRTTINIMRRVKRLVEALCRRTDYSDLPDGAAWFGELCDFLISAVCAQKSAAAAKALFPSFRAALESLLSLLMVWELKSSSMTAILAKMEAKLGAIYSTTASSVAFAEGLPDLLFSFLHINDNLHKKQFTKKSPLATHFRKTAATAAPNSRFLERVERHILMVFAAMTHSQVKKLKSRLGALVEAQLMGLMAVSVRAPAQFKYGSELLDRHCRAMDRRESSFRDSISFGRPSNASFAQTPRKEPPPVNAPQPKPETLDVAHVDDSWDRACRSGLTYSLRTVHPKARHSESACPTPVPPSQSIPQFRPRCANRAPKTRPPDARQTSRLIREVPPAAEGEERRPSLPPPIPIHTPIHAFPRSTPRGTLLKECQIDEEVPVDLSLGHRVDENRVAERDLIKTPTPQKNQHAHAETPGTCQTVHSGTIAGNLIMKFLQDDIDPRIAKEQTWTAMKSSSKPSHH